MKKAIIYLLTIMLLAVSAFAAPEVTSETTTDITVSTATAAVVINETVHCNFYLYTGGTADGNIILTDLTHANGTTCGYGIAELDGETVYYWKVNGTNANGAFTSSVNAFTTSNYKITGAARIVANLFVFVLLALALFNVWTNWSGDTIFKIKVTAVHLLGAIILNQLLIAILGL